MKPIALVLAFLSVFVPAAHAQEYHTFRLPPGHRCDTYQCFDLGEYTQLLHMDEDLRYLTDVHAADLIRIDGLTSASTELRHALELVRLNEAALLTERDRLTTMWEEANRLRHEAENRPDWSWIPWTLAGVFAVTTLTLGLVIGVSR